MAQQHHRSRETLDTASARRWLSQALLAAVYFAALSVLVVWEYRDRFDALDHQCHLTDAPAHTFFYNRPYARLLDWSAGDTARHVTELAIPIGLEEIQSNACLGRAYMADVLRTLTTLHPSIVVIDKFYSPSTCASMPESTADLLSAAAVLSVPLVVGESTQPSSEHNAVSCLCRKPQLDFGSANVHHGLTRLNTETEKLPLQWNVLPDPHATHTELADSIALTTVKLYDPDYTNRPRIQALLQAERHPYANLELELPRATTTALLCQAGTPEMRQHWQIDCTSAPAQRLNITGRVVVVGAESKDDLRTVLDRQRWGFDLQAHYIEALLSGTFLRTIPFTAAFVIFAAFIFMTEAVPTLLSYFRPGWKHKRFLCHAYGRHRYFWTTFWAIAWIVATSIVSLGMHYLPPLIMFGDIALVAMTRLLVFAAESTEHPLLHPHAKGHHTHVTSTETGSVPTHR